MKGLNHDKISTILGSDIPSGSEESDFSSDEDETSNVLQDFFDSGANEIELELPVLDLFVPTHITPAHDNPTTAPSTSSTAVEKAVIVEPFNPISPLKTRKQAAEKRIVKDNSKEIPPRMKKNTEFPTIWHAGKENNLSDNPPQFHAPASKQLDAETPYQFFALLFPDRIFDKIVAETNRYAYQHGKNFTITSGEARMFLGMNIAMTYIKYPNIRMYWSSVEGIRMNFIADAMSANRFEEIKKYWHYANNEDMPDPIIDRYWKLRPILDLLNESFLSAADIKEHYSVDETLIPFKGRSGLKQYIKNKPKKWGFKIWVLAGIDGYVRCFEPYQTIENRRSEFGPIGDSVLRICHDIKGRNCKLFMDNLFTTLPLLRELRLHDIYVLGTFRLNRASGIQESLVPGKLLSRGSCCLATSNDNITIVRWIDNKEVHTISTYAGALPTDEAKRYDRKNKKIIEIPRPYSIQQYNMFMGGVDLADRMVAHYPHGLKSRKWYHRIFYHFVNVALVNAWTVYKNQNPPMPFLQFKAAVATSLIALGKISQTRKRGRPSTAPETPEAPKKKTPTMKASPEVRFDGLGHYPKKVPATHAPRCHDPNCWRRTRYACEKCDEPVCPECMQNFHTR